MDPSTLSENERTALGLLLHQHGLLVSHIPDRNDCDVLGETTPGRGVYDKLTRKGLCFETEEEPAPDGFQFTPTMELTDLGRQVAEELCQPRTSPGRKPR